MSFAIEEVTISQLHAAYRAGETTARSVVRAYLPPDANCLSTGFNAAALTWRSTSPSSGVGSGNSSTHGGFPSSRSTAARIQ